MTSIIHINLSRREVVLGGMAGAAVVPLWGCGGGAVVGALVPSFAPFFVFTYSGVVERKIVTVNFFPSKASSGKTSGTFDTSNISVAGQQFQFTGTFSERTLMITVAAPLPPLAAVYNGLFTEDETIVLTPVQAGRLPITVRLDRIDPPATRFLPALTGDWIGVAANGAPWRLTLATDPVNAFPLVDPGDATVLLTGSETLGAAAAVTLLGYASVHYIELDIARAGGTVHLTGTLQASATPPAAGQSQTTATITFNGGGSLHRAP
jgi:hypothetical protein